MAKTNRAGLADDFHKAWDGVEIELRSTGRWVQIRSFNIGTFLTTGVIPDELTAFVEKTLLSPDSDDSTGQTRSQLATALGLTELEYVRKDRALLEVYAQHCFVRPKVRENTTPENDLDKESEILACQLTYDELMEVFEAVQLPARELEKFRGKQTPAMEAVQPSGEV